jgi:hypothetical protein
MVDIDYLPFNKMRELDSPVQFKRMILASLYEEERQQ